MSTKRSSRRKPQPKLEKIDEIEDSSIAVKTSLPANGTKVKSSRTGKKKETKPKEIDVIETPETADNVEENNKTQKVSSKPEVSAKNGKETKPAKRGRKATKVVTAVEEPVNVAADEEDLPPAKPSRRRTKKSTTQTTDEVVEDAPKPKVTRTRKQKTPAGPVDDVKEESAEIKEDIQAAEVKEKRTGRKRGAKAASEEPAVEKKSKPEAKTKAKSSKKTNETDIMYKDLDFSIEKEYNLKISSWNVAGMRAWLQKGALQYIEHEKPDIICLQETKCIPENMPDEAWFTGYHPYWLCKPGGNAGVAIYSKAMPFNVEYGIGDEEQDEQGRMLTAEYEKFFLICVYVPNSGRGLVTLPKRLRWNEIFKKKVNELNAKKPVIIAGDMNVSHTEIDLANPKSNKKNAGFTQEERDGMTDFLSNGYIDSFRYFYPDMKNAYTYWTYMANARSKNVGWRLDYFLVSERFMPKIVDCVFRSKVMGSDHCPITLFLNV